LNFEALQVVLEHVRPNVVFYLGNIPVTSSVVNTWIVMAIVIPLSYVIGKRIRTVPHGMQHLAEMVAEFFYGLLDETMGKEGRKFIPLVGTLFIFILCLNLSWFIPGIMPPTTDLSTTLGFAVVTIIAVQIIGIKKRGIGGYIKHFFQPNPFLFPLNLLEELVKPVSLSLRLFANMFGEETVVLVLFILIPLLSPTPVMLLGIIMGLIQALVFSLLTVVYISNFIHGH
jgi:F-type H+-transporting ATPase subunit a